MNLPGLESLGDVGGKKVLVRSDLNVPLGQVEDSGGQTITDDFRIRQAAPTWQWLIERGAKVTVCSHLGRPKGKSDARYSMDPVRARAQEIVPGIEVMENLRFDAGEEANDAAFVQQLIDGQDLYVDDAFGAVHRVHASIVGPPQFLPSAAGLLLAREIDMLGPLLDSPPKPFLAILGGAKISDKIGVIDALLAKVDTLLVGGGMAYTFLKAEGHDVGDSLLQADQLDYCRRVLDSDKRVVLPTDLIVANDSGDVQVVKRDVPDGFGGFDIGPNTRAAFAEEVIGAQTIFWNGPLGMFEDKRFAQGTRSIAEAMGKTGGTSIIGGGDVVSAVNGFGLADQMDWVSTGGGATLELIEKGDLPGLAALRSARA